ncbi:Yip1 family protein [Saliphagus sp. LR7]|uniref:Yip1 family protein n=1 Tax=Saliphagus sp. LR7 TaxID=2282654 RepID=UPI000DF77009|nr:Yip1 family protein [Saliphagus sp. LR7]
MSPIDPLVRPDRFFDRQRWDWLLASSAAVVVVLALVSGAGFVAMGWVLADEVTGTTTVDNPAYVPDWVCEQQGEDGPTQNACDEPERIEVETGEVLWDAWADPGNVGALFFSVLLAWPLTAVALQVVSRLAGGEGSFRRTLAVAGWGMAPTVLEVALVVGLWWYQVRTMALSSDPEALVGQVEGIEPLAGGAVLAITFGIWQWYVWTHGLKHGRELSVRAAAGAAGAVAVVSILFGLA